MSMTPATLAVITPAFNEATNLEALHRRLSASLDAIGLSWRWIVVDDHSADDTFAVLRRLAASDARVGAVRLSRNCGSHAAIGCGLHHATADAVIVLASDLQDPPEVAAALVDEWRRGAQIVWAVRRQRPGESVATLGFARLYYFLMRNLVGIRALPAQGSDCFLLDRRVVRAFRAYRERHTSVLALLAWMGFRQTTIDYDKAPRHSGRSGWTLRKKLRLVADSVTAFTGAPLLLAAWVGVGLVMLWLFGAIRATLGGGPALAPDGVAWLTQALMFLALGVAGAYVWRALDESRARPAWMVEDAVNIDALIVPGSGCHP